MSMRHLSDNPIDQVISLNLPGGLRAEARRRLLARYVPGRPIADVHRSLENFGSKCFDMEDGPIVCRYTQFLFVGNRGIFADEWRVYEYFDFTIRLLASRGALRDITVCYTTTKEKQKGPVFGKPDKPRQSEFESCP